MAPFEFVLMLVLGCVALGNGRRKHKAKQRRSEEKNWEQLAEAPFVLGVNGSVLEKTDGGPNSTGGTPMYLGQQKMLICVFVPLRPYHRIVILMDILLTSKAIDVSMPIFISTTWRKHIQKITTKEDSPFGLRVSKLKVLDSIQELQNLRPACSRPFNPWNCLGICIIRPMHAKTAVIIMDWKAWVPPVSLAALVPPLYNLSHEQAAIEPGWAIDLSPVLLQSKYVVGSTRMSSSSDSVVMIRTRMIFLHVLAGCEPLRTIVNAARYVALDRKTRYTTSCQWYDEMLHIKAWAVIAMAMPARAWPPHRVRIN